jgi:ABC-type uncharacterized transport system substrate-binding protein
MMSSKLRYSARYFKQHVLAAFVAAMAFAAPALAHPHIWVTMRTTVLYENGAIVGLRHAWTFDQYYSEMAIDGLDKDKDGKYSREELAELAKVNVEALKEFAYFTYPKLAGADLAVAAPEDYYLEHKVEHAKAAAAAGGAPADPKSGAEKIAEAAARPVPVLTLHFTLPLTKPVLADAEGFSFAVGDQTFFIAFEPAADNPVTLGQGAPEGCKVLHENDSEASDAKPSKPGDLMAGQASDLSVSIVSAPVWRISCRRSG